jgi:PadR family transcriptional regulator PadR
LSNPPLHQSTEFAAPRISSCGFHLTSKRQLCSLECQVKKMPIQILQGTLDLMILRTLSTMGPQHAYGIANRLQQVSEDALNLNQGTIYPALVRIEQHGWTRGSWGKTENNREAKYYTITRAGLKALNEETERWRQMAGVVEKLLAEEQ